jgi:Domain of unknown function (DUF6924)
LPRQSAVPKNPFESRLQRRRLLKTLPIAENPSYSLVLRTDYSDDSAWQAVCQAIEEPELGFGFRAYVQFVSDPEYDSIPAHQIPALVPEDAGATFIFVVDHTALSHPEHPIQVVGLFDKPGRTIRVIPSEIWNVQNNLSIANGDFGEFAGAAGGDGVFRGFPDP